MLADFRLIWVYFPALCCSVVCGCLEQPTPPTGSTSAIKGPVEAVFSVVPKSWQTHVLVHEVTSDFEKDLQFVAIEVACRTKDNPVSVTLARKSCGCVGVLLDNNELAVGESFDVGHDLARKLLIKLPQNYGSLRSVRQRVVLSSGLEEVPIDVALDVLPALSVEPQMLSAQISKNTEIVAVPFAIRGISTDAARLELVPVVSLKALDGVTTSLKSSSAIIPWGKDHSERTWMMELRIPVSKVPPDSSMIEWGVSVSLGDGNHGYSIPYTRLFLKRVHGITAPKVVHFNQIGAGRSHHRKFVVRSLDDTPFDVKVPSAENPNCKVVIADVGDRRRHIVDVEVSREKVGDFEFPLKLETSHRDSPEVEVLIRGRVDR